MNFSEKEVHNILEISRWFILFQLLDLLTTVFAIVFLGASEANPLLNSYSLPEITFIKFFAIILVVNIFVNVQKTSVTTVKNLTILSALAPIYNLAIIIIYIWYY